MKPSRKQTNKQGESEKTSGLIQVVRDIINETREEMEQRGDQVNTEGVLPGGPSRTQKKLISGIETK